MLYSAVLVACILCATGYKLRSNGIFACDPSGYGADRYIAYCQASAFGDYDYGAFWYGLEPSASTAAANADALFIGNSRTQFALSTNAIERWFRRNSASYYLLGFAYNGNMAFAGPLLGRLHPQAKVYMVSVDLFFRRQPTEPAAEVMQDSAAVGKYQEKRFWEFAQRTLCGRIASLCRHELAYYRSRRNGAWLVAGGDFKPAPVVYSDSIDRKSFADEVALGRDFLSHLPVSRDCIILTETPKAAALSGTSLGTARALAQALGFSLIAPELKGLKTFDGSHLDRASAETWSAELIRQAGPTIQKCTRSPRP